MPFPPADAVSRTDLADCVCLAGPTAAGKSAVALALAAALERVRPVEIVSVDSALVYRGMDIGTAKPTPAERARVPHHLIDLIDPAEAYSAARFVADAGAAITGIRQRGHLPLLVGGTMLYVKALIDGIDAMPAADPQVRAAIEAHARRDGWAALHTELSRVDPATASRLAPGDSQRIQRALEVFRVSGRPLSSFHRRGTESAPAPPLLISLEPDDRAWLHDRIEQRFGAMLEGGLVEEVQALRQRGDLRADLPSMRCVGYRQVWAALDDGALADLRGLADRGAAATRQLAKRQLTWLRSMPWRRRVACDAADATAQVLAIVGERLVRTDSNV